MINVIFLQKIEPILTKEQRNIFSSANWINSIAECRVIDWVEVVQALSSSIEELEKLKQILISFWKFVSVIWLWDNNGIQYWYKKINTWSIHNQVYEVVRDETITINYPFSISDYCNFLSDKPEWWRYTEEEAKNIQINVFGWNPIIRDLNTYN